MPLVEIEKIYQKKAEIEEYQKVINESKNLKFIGNCIWELNISQILEKEKINDKELKAWNRLYGFLDDLTAQEWQQFNEAIKRRSLFGGKYNNK
jgi:hypothetical protein